MIRDLSKVPQPTSCWGGNLMEPQAGIPPPSPRWRLCRNVENPMGSLWDGLTAGSPRFRVKGMRGLDKGTGSIWATD